MKKYVCGAKQVLLFLTQEKLETVYIAKEADIKTLLNEIVKLAEMKNVEVIYMDTLEQIGKLCNIDVGRFCGRIIKGGENSCQHLTN